MQELTRKVSAITAGLLLAMVIGALAGCQTSAVIDDLPAAQGSGLGNAFKTDMAVFSVSQNGRQTIVLAGGETTEAAPEPPPPPAPGTAAVPVPATSRYRVYLLLVVNTGGGTWQIGQEISGGQVRATYYIYDANGRLTVVPDRGGTITTKVWPMLGSPDPQEWWTSGTFDLVMGTDRRLSGKFMARSAPVLVNRFLRDRKL